MSIRMKLFIIDEGLDKSYIAERPPASILPLEISANLCPENLLHLYPQQYKFTAQVRMKRNKTDYSVFDLDVYQKTTTLPGLLSDLKVILGGMDSLDTAVAFIVLPSNMASATAIAKVIEAFHDLSSILFIEKFTAGQEDNHNINELQLKGCRRVEYPKLKPVSSNWSNNLGSQRTNEKLLVPLNLAFYEVLEKSQQQFMDLSKRAEELRHGGEQPEPII